MVAAYSEVPMNGDKKSQIIRQYITKRDVDSDKPSRNLQPEIERLKAVLGSIEGISSTTAEWERLYVELTKLVKVVELKKSPIRDIRITKGAARYRTAEMMADGLPRAKWPD